MWVYDYNDRDELTGARRYWADWSPVSGQLFGYDYDNIGNRKSAWAGGDVNGASLHQTIYTANALNQYTVISNPGYEQVLGVALATNAVTVNTTTADRKVEYFHREISVANGSGPCWTDTSVASGGATASGGIITPASSQTLFYDADGNLTYDGLWTYEWDAENRLIGMSMTNATSLPNAKRLRLDFAYDYRNRRVQKSVSTWNGSGFANPTTTLFVYELSLTDAGGWNLLAELNTSLSPLRTYAWGQDLSGTIDQAGGIGGLILLTVSGTTSTNCFVGYDGNGNVTALVDSASLGPLARYEYSPYGEPIRITEPLALGNRIRFSSKYYDSESALTFYGHRYYFVTTGRWITRDPSQERDGDNLYWFIGNCPIDRADRNGLDTYFCNRRISGDEALASGGAFLDYFVHGFVFTTDDNGNVENTFSWGNNGGRKGWVADAANDKRAANTALKKGWAVHVGDRAFDALVKQAFEHLYGSPESKHRNGGIFGYNCRTEAWNLIHQAELYQEMEEDEE